VDRFIGADHLAKAAVLLAIDVARQVLRSDERMASSAANRLCGIAQEPFSGDVPGAHAARLVASECRFGGALDQGLQVHRGAPSRELLDYIIVYVVRSSQTIGSFFVETVLSAICG
jgi:hypothetical protein